MNYYQQIHQEFNCILNMTYIRPNLLTKEGTIYCKKSLDYEYSVPDDSYDILIQVFISLLFIESNKRR